jgi:hypothetical protein
MEHMQTFWIFQAVVITAVLSFGAVVIWVRSQRKEREEYYRAETMKKVAETGAAAAAIEFARERDRLARAGLRRGLQLAGLVTLAAGVGFGIFAAGIEKNEPIYLLSAMPILVGLVLFVFGQFMVPED